MNFKGFGNEAAGGDGGGGGGRAAGSFSLARQPSVYSLTFDEFMTSMGGSGKDFGSMNMDELLKNIWTAEEVQTMASAGVAADDGGAGVSHLQRQGSLTLPRTLSQKTVDEVWKDISKEYGGHGGPHLAQTQQRQPTLGEMTLEEFLVRAGVVREDAKPNDAVFMDLARAGNNNALGLGFQQMNKVAAATGLMGNRLSNDPLVGLQSPANLPLNVNGVRSSNQQQMQSPQSQQHQQQQQIFPKQSAMSYAAAQMPQGMVRGGMVGLGGDQGLSVQGGGIGMVGLAPGSVHVTTGSPAANQMSGDKMAKSNGDTSSVSPVPYVFNGGLRGRKSGGAVEKVIERRQRRMIKNRESAARSRARKQAYTMELEAEVAKLKEENQELQKKQEEIMEIQKNQAKEMMNLQREVKRRRLRRTQTGPW
ncbi:ABSCISIC ACID-INSENSITIVE 5-like protein 5 [Cajanus cajan]|uniref:ABSCISIC ACID-INSENSITIVE 5-like protein 5 n=1 Tax=Cajanus cajan TaxID=3821 RepID=UPI00098DCD57|nr:ABSCISIC ACID-INSENSITIVE 5-like protein 5 [Cajanus cajan]XP_020218722.1 ABSCISIC ACID-INSENSITIVE 5-like protein 5 [Cajanus cajan]XP_029128098.1 ABSCISIC ACID-INSENSITIVE 5-like protein 5 [Cajanus cajan]